MKMYFNILPKTANRGVPWDCYCCSRSADTRPIAAARSLRPTAVLFLFVIALGFLGCGDSQPQETAEAPTAPTVEPPKPEPKAPAQVPPEIVQPVIPATDFQPINLLDQIVTKRDALHGVWGIKEDALISPPFIAGARIQIPGEVPKEYQLTLVTERLAGDEYFVVGLVVEGRQVMLQLDWTPFHISGLSTIDDRQANQNETTYEGTAFTNGEPVTIVATVRHSTIRVTWDDKEIINWRGDPSRLSLIDYWKVPDPQALFLASTRSSFRISKLELRSIGVSDHSQTAEPNALAASISPQPTTPPAQPTATLAGHEKPVFALDLIPSTNRPITASFDSTLRVWDLSTSKATATVNVPDDELRTIAVSPDGERFATAGSRGTIAIWNTSTLAKTAEITEHTRTVNEIAFSPNGRLLASAGSDNRTILWESATGRLIRQFSYEHPVLALTFIPGTNFLAIGGADKYIDIWDVTTNKRVSRLDGHTGEIRALAASPNGALLASASTDNSVRIWDIYDAQQTALFDGHKNWVVSAAFSPDGSLVASGDVKSLIKLWDPRTGQEIQELTGHDERIGDLAFTRDGQQLLSTSYDKTLRVWRFSEPRPSPAPSEKPVASPIAAIKHPVPDLDTRRELGNNLKELFKTEYADAKSPPQRIALAQTLLAQAKETTDSPNERFGLLTAAHDLAADAAMPRMALDIVETLSNEYELDRWEARVAAVSAAAGHARSQAQNNEIAQLAVDMVDESVKTQNYKSAAELAQIAVLASRKAQNRDLTTEAVALRTKVNTLRRDYDAAQEAIAALEKTPDSPTANLTLGRYHCIHDNNWTKGLPMLRKSNDSDLRRIVDMDLANPSSVGEQIVVADAWWEWVEKDKSDKRRLPFQRAAYYWYAKAAQNATGLEKLRIEKRLAEFEHFDLPRVDP